MNQRDLELISSIIRFVANNPGEDAFASGASMLSFRNNWEEVSLQDRTQPGAAALINGRRLSDWMEEINSMYDTLQAEKERAEMLAARLEEEREAAQRREQQLRTEFAREVQRQQQESQRLTGVLQEKITQMAALDQRIQKHFFDTYTQLKQVLPDSLVFQHTQQHESSFALHLADKFGVVHLLLTCNPFKDERAAQFNTYTRFALNDFVKRHRYVTASQMLAHWHELVSLTLTPHDKVPLPDACALIADVQNREIEYASTGSPLITVSGNLLNEHKSGPDIKQVVSASSSADAIGNLVYTNVRLNLRWHTNLFFCLPDPDAAHQANPPHEEPLAAQFRKLMLASAAKTTHEQKAAWQNFTQDNSRHWLPTFTVVSLKV